MVEALTLRSPEANPSLPASQMKIFVMSYW